MQAWIFGKKIKHAKSDIWPYLLAGMTEIWKFMGLVMKRPMIVLCQT
jgi:hypothetical protein